MHYRLQLTLCTLIFLSIQVLNAQAEFYFKQISLKEGLSQPTVKAILYDSKGYIWIGTRAGLNRFDKHEVKNYFNEYDNPASLPDNQITILTEDSLNNLWVGTSGGLALYNRKNNNFSTITVNGKTIYVSTSMPVEDGIVFGGYNLYKYNYLTRQIKEIKYERKQKDFITFIHSWNNGLWLLGTRWDGLWLYNPNTGQMHHSFVQEKNISAYYIDRSGNLWLSPYGKGLQCYSPQGQLLEEYHTRNSQLTNDIILDITEKDKNIWIATDGGGICILDRQKNTIHNIRHMPGDATSIPANSINCLYLDRENNMWAGTIREGLLYVRNVYMKTYCAVTPENSYGLSENAVICLYEDNRHTLWIGTDGGGLNAMNPRTRQFKHFTSKNTEKITSITQLSPDKLLLSTFGEGLYTFNTRTHTFEPFLFINREINDRTYRTGRNIYLHNAGNNKIYFFSDSIYAYHIGGKKFHGIHYNTQPDKTVITSSLNRFYSDQKKSYLFSISNIFELDHEKDELTPVYYAKYPAIINSVCKDRTDRFWIGTNKGLICYNPATRQSRTIKTSLFHEISAIVYDSGNQLWIGAQGMLFTYIINENKFVIWGESNGVSPNEYLTGATLTTHSGNIYMGGSSGLLYINNNIRFEKDLHPAFEITDIQLNGSTVLNQKNTIPSKLEIPWNHTSLAIKIQVTENDIFRKKIFRYHISGAQNSYDIETYDHTLMIHALATGKYTITVSCNLQDGSWSRPVKLLDLQVTPPWWRNGWFIYSLLLFFALSIIAAATYSTRRKESKLKWEMKEHEEEVNKEKIRFLINISHELRTPLTLIYAPLKRLLKNKKFEDDTQRQLTGIYKQTKQMRNIINMVLDARKMEVGQNRLYLQQHPLNEWIKNITEDFRYEFENKGIDIRYELDDQIKNVVFDANKCEIVLSNLLMNALKFSNENTEVTIKTEIRNNNVQVLVKDQGIGLGNITEAQLFTRFSQGSHQLQGSGIGLSYAKTLIEMHQGHIGAYNNLDQGSTFYFELPLIRDEQVIRCKEKNYLNELLYTPKETLQQEEPAINLSKYTILIVEDENDLRHFLADSLSGQFSKIYTAANGADALPTIKKYLPDIIVSDVMMPKMDGFTLCKTIKSDISLSHIPVILLTARNDQESTSLGYKLGADAYLAKPFDIEFLLTLIQNQLRIREQIRKRYQENTAILLPEEMTFSNADEDFMLKLNKTIKENLPEPTLDVKFLVDKMNVSRSALYNKVKQLTGMGVNDYINKFRIEAAIQLLEQTNLSILEISEQSGFSNQSYFSITFKQATGLSPSKYKEKYKNKDKQPT